MAEPSATAGGLADRYPQLLRTPRARWWRPPLGLALAGLTLASGAVAVVLAATVLSVLTGATDDPFAEEGLSADTPIGLLANNLVIVMMVPASAIAVLAVHRERVGWLASVTCRVRWGLLGRLLGVALAVVLVFFGASFLLPSSAGGDAEAPGLGTFLALLAVISLTTPLQAAAEEVGFRGYLTQALASWFARPAVGTVVAGAVSALLFALAHGTQDAWLFADRLAFGVVASWLAWRTGGLEAAIALHVANNVVSLVYTAATGSLEATLTASTLEWQFAVLDVAMMVGYAAVVDRLARRWAVVVRRVPLPGVLSGPRAVGYPGPRPSPPPAGGETPWGMG